MSAKITIKNNGSIHVEGDFEIFDWEGEKFNLSGRTLVKLCRCGHSLTKPFCDGSHKQLPFHSEIKAFTLPPRPAPAAGAKSSGESPPQEGPPGH